MIVTGTVVASESLTQEIAGLNNLFLRIIFLSLNLVVKGHLRSIRLICNILIDHAPNSVEEKLIEFLQIFRMSILVNTPGFTPAEIT